MGDLLSNMAMLVCEFSIDNENVVWLTNIYENIKYVCPIHKKMVLNQIELYKYHSNKKININIQIKPSGSQKFLILYLTKAIGIIKIKKNHYGIEIFITIKEKYRKKDIVLFIFICVYEYVHSLLNINELIYIEINKENKEYLQACKQLGLQDITTYGHISSKIFKF
jgi:hypothetical protein